MIDNIIQDKAYQALAKNQVKTLIEYLLENDFEFSITANIKAIKFEPELPSSILDRLAPFSLFVLANYTFSTIKIDDEYLSFEAGFGAENFGSLVQIPLLAVFQIIVEESILYINSTATLEKFFEKQNLKEKSLNVFKNNPNNKNLIK
jgi:hypothetical protein